MTDPEPARVEQDVSAHYTTGDLLDRILSALSAAGHDPDALTPDVLKPVDEFHIGGAQATRDLLAQVGFGPGMEVLDIGCGIGGPARLVADETGATVTGIDLTPELVDTARALTDRVGLSGKASFRQGSALDMPLGAESFDGALLLHVGMNIPDKAKLMAEAARVLKPGGTFAVYDVMRTGEGDLDFPVPWSDRPGTSFLETPDTYRAAAEAAGFRVEATRDRRDFALAFFEKMRASAGSSDVPNIGIAILMAETGAAKIGNMIANIEAGRIAPVEMILMKPA